jgi:uroporphyrin-III C-methyltransferase
MREDAANGARTDSEREADLDDRRSRRPRSLSTEEWTVSPRPSASGDVTQLASGQARPTTAPESVPGTAETATGTVSLVGAGPGDPELLTRKAWKRLEMADVVLHDSLTSDEVIEELPEEVEVVDVGKRPPNRTNQDEINELMCERSRRGERVVRLKGGDPNVFGRGGEEAEYLAAEDVTFEVVPGISSVLAAPSVGGFPLTHRHRASSLTVITGHQTPEKEESALDWGALAETVGAGGTLVILMGVKRLPENVRALREHQVPPETPVGMVQKATWRDEEILTGTLETIVNDCRDAGIDPPATTVVGDVVTVRDAVESQFLD